MNGTLVKQKSLILLVQGVWAEWVWGVGNEGEVTSVSPLRNEWLLTLHPLRHPQQDSPDEVSRFQACHSTSK